MKKHLLLLFVVLPLSGAWAQECQSESPAEQLSPVKVQGLAWMNGYWRGQLKDGATVEQYFAPAAGGVSTGIFRLTTPDGGQLYEVFVLRDTERGPELRVRHFAKDFSPLEPGDKPIVMHLSASGPACAEFVNETSSAPKRSVLVRRRNTLRTRSDIVRADGTTGSIEAEWQRGGADVPAAASGSGLPQIAWITGHWTGSFEGGAIEQWWLAPKGGVMAGVMRFAHDDRVSMIEFYGAKNENGKLRTYTWQLRPELLLTDKNPMMTAEAIRTSPNRLVFRVLSKKLDATTTVTHRGNRMQERVEVKQNGKAITMVIDFAKSEAPQGTPAERKGGQ
jgi:hypothetical protein